MTAVTTCLLLVSADVALGQSGRTGWDGAWVGGWDRRAGVQVIFGSPTLAVGRELFWGDDRLDDAIAWHRHGTLKDRNRKLFRPHPRCNR